MSEETKQKLSEYLDKKFNEMNENQKKSLLEFAASLKSTSNSKPPHTHSANVAFDCPECQAAYDKAVSEKALKEFKHKIKSMKTPHLCDGENCEEIYDAEEKDDCPTCHRH